MINKILPIGSIIELEDNNKYIIIGYNTFSRKNFSYVCAGYPTCSLIDMIPTKKINEFKLYLSDIGLFTTMLFNDKRLISENIYNKLLSDKLEANLGYLYENAIAQIINSNNRELYYHAWREKDKTHQYEIDFLLSERNKIIPIEVKSSNHNNHTSINNFSKK